MGFFYKGNILAHFQSFCAITSYQRGARPSAALFLLTILETTVHQFWLSQDHVNLFGFKW